MKNLKTKLLGSIAGLVTLFSPGLAQAQAWPSKPVRVIVPVTAGGLSDVIARAMSAELSKIWGQTVVVENKPGAGHIIATEFVVKSPADGYTVLMTDRAMSANPFLYKKLPYDASKDLTPVANMILITSVLLAHPGFAPRTLQELVAAAKDKPGTINYGSFGKGTVTHVDMEAFAAKVGIKLVHIPYKGIADVLPALASGQIQIALAGIPPALTLIRSGALRTVALAGAPRSRLLPDTPTSTEAGFPGLLSESWTGFFVPSATPAAVVGKFGADMGRVIDMADFRTKYITGVGLEPLFLGPENFAEYLRNERASMVERMKGLDVQLD